MLDKETRLQALREFTDCFYHVWSWRLDRFFNVIQSDCPHESLIRSVFLRDGRRDAMEAHMNTSRNVERRRVRWKQINLQKPAAGGMRSRNCWKKYAGAI